jgi:hypothetical protein
VIEAAIYAALSPLVNGRVYPDTAPPGVAKPFVTYQQVGGRPVNFLANAQADKRNSRVQVNCWADTRLAASTLAVNAEAALISATSMQARPLGNYIALNDPDVPIYGTQQDFDCWR